MAGLTHSLEADVKTLEVTSRLIGGILNGRRCDGLCNQA